MNGTIGAAWEPVTRLGHPGLLICHESCWILVLGNVGVDVATVQHYQQASDVLLLR